MSIIIGPNASGKTNLLEAVYILCEGGSFRVSDKDLIYKKSEWARLDMIIDGDERGLKLRSSLPRTAKTYLISGDEKRRLGFDDTIPVVLFEPDDIRIIGGSPERRREYLDILLSNLSANYKKSLASYRRALRQRNNLLKKGTDSNSIFAWNIVLARHAEQIVGERTEIIEQIAEQASKVYQQLSGRKDKISLTYLPTLPAGSNYSSRFVAKLEGSFSLDSLRGHTSIGPHRDDLDIKINGNPAATHASRGEARTITLALKIIEMALIEKHRAIKPLLLLDDVFSELDGIRRRMLTEHLKDHQVIITTTDADVISKDFAKLSNLISL